MKTVKLTLIMKVTDEYYAKELLDEKKEIDSGKWQKELMEGDKRGIKDIKMTFEIIKG